MRQTNAVVAAFVGLLAVGAAAPARAGDIFGHTGLSGGSRWDAGARTISSNERSLVGGLRFSLQGGSYTAYRDSFTWDSVPTVPQFQTAVEQAFAAWGATDPATGLTSPLTFVADFGTAVVGTGTFGGVNINGAEIDLLAINAGDTGTRAVTFFNAISANVTLTSGPTNYPGGFAISGADITMNNNPGAVYNLDFFRRLLTHEIGHAIGLGDVENANASAQFIDDNYNGTNATTAQATLTNSWALLVNTLNPALSPLSLYIVPDANPGIDTPGVDILMESNGLGIATGNPLTNLVPLTNDDYGTRQFLYPVPEPSSAAMIVFAAGAAGLRRRRGKRA